MRAIRSTFIFSIAAFLLGFALGGLSFHVAPAEGVFGLKTSMIQIESALVEMEKNISDLQKNMGTIKQAKDRLSSLPPAEGDAIKKESDSVKPTIPGIGR
jgi:hypothetical protein